jgi:outer membrane protein OmpA-like peptidoglycan-associated protein
MRYLFLTLILLLSVNLFSQKKYATTSKKAIKYYQEAVAAFNKMDYVSTEENLNKAIKKDDKFIDAYLLRSELYRTNRMYNRQIADLQAAISINDKYFPYVYYNLGAALLISGRYKEAKNAFNNFILNEKAKQSSKNKALRFIKQCEFAQSLVDNPVDFKPESLGDSINTDNDEYWPSLSIDGNTLYYSVLLVDSSRHTAYGTFAHQEDFFVSRKVNNKWSKGKPLGKPINTKDNEGALKVSADGKIIVFTACNRPKAYGRCDIYFAFKTSNGWSKPVNAGGNINTRYSEKQPCLSADGTRIYFSSDRPGGIGGMDIWYSDLNEQGYWQKPKNMGKIINTKYDEESPFLHPDNQTFYFSSDGHHGLGMKDIFYCRKNDSTDWATPENIGYPVNTYRDEIGLFIDNTGETAYFSSNYNNSSRNIYKFNMPVEARPLSVSYLSGIIIDKENKHPLQANILLLETKSGDTVMNVISHKKGGDFLVCLPSGENYALNVSCNGYLFKSINFDLSETSSYQHPHKEKIELERVKINSTIVLNNIFFKTDSYELLPNSKAELIKTAEYIKNNKRWIFEIGGHTDQRGSDDYNMQLSKKRAEAVYNYLIKNGVNPSVLTYKGYGKSKPVAIGNNSKSLAKNRRTELKIIKKME